MKTSHYFQLLEATSRLEAELSALDQRVFESIPLDPIPEEGEEGEEDVAAEPDRSAEARQLEPLQKPKRLRHSYSIKQKYKVLHALDKTEEGIRAALADAADYYAGLTFDHVSRKTGIPITTLRDWVSDKETICKRHEEDRQNRRLRRVGSGRHALFPKAEAVVAALIREHRSQCKLVSKGFLLRQLKNEAEKENPAAFSTSKFSAELVSNFMRRNGFSLRYPSCIRSHDLATAILICRSYHRELLRVLADDGEKHYAKKPLHSSFGRFALKYRFNGDEVPYRFGRVRSVVSLSQENLTHVTWPAGWEARLATLFLVADATGRIILCVVIFQGSFQKPSKKRRVEVASLKSRYPMVRVYFQKKAWMDGLVLTEITKEVLLSFAFFDYSSQAFYPYVRDLWAADQVDFAESLLVLDNGPGRNDPAFLQALGKPHTFLMKLPPNQTGYVQMIDDNVGRIFRDLACDVLEQQVEAMSSEAQAALSSEQKRELMVKSANEALLTWNGSAKYVKIGSDAALRTGLAMRIDNFCAGVLPTRFPAGYEATIPASSGAPVRSYFSLEPAPAPALIATLSTSTPVSLQVTPTPSPDAVEVCNPPSCHGHSCRLRSSP